MRQKLAVLLLFVAVLMMGCRGTIYHGGTNWLEAENTVIFLPPFENATDDEHAGRALTELTASALYERALPIIQTEPTLAKARLENAAGPDGLWIESARSVGATHIVLGTIHEYRYKTDLDGDPAVGVTLRIVDASNGKTVWQGTSGKVNVMFASLTKTSQRAIWRLVKRVPVFYRDEWTWVGNRENRRRPILKSAEIDNNGFPLRSRRGHFYRPSTNSVVVPTAPPSDQQSPNNPVIPPTDPIPSEPGVAPTTPSDPPPADPKPVDPPANEPVPEQVDLK